eukprot:TRINITY_DN18688_c0_g2_i1.p1 TRINITY_DN18688_c0_g2~~TRINITY_DN18688_c0_g2_i1.p1  ORF type:complete len:1084 (+),score=216.60 TRINITY_DN18688_c0_g2_i1:2149-5400(+)
MLINDIKDGQCASNTLEEYNGSLPPYHIIDAFDDGWSDLSPDEYVAYRLIPLIKRYDRAAKYYEGQLSLFTVSNYVLGAIGTLLAALSSVPPLDTYNLQAWVALTTGISNAATRYMDYCRMDFLQKKSNKVKMSLHDVQSWWDSRGNESESQAVKNELVTRVEALITGEFVEWGGQMKKEMDKSKKDKSFEDAQDMVKKLAGEEAVEQMTQIKELGLADISADNLLAALENPDGPERKKIFDSMTRLSNHIEQSTGFDADKILEHNLIKEAEKQATALKSITNESLLDDVGQLLHKNLGGMSMGDFVPADLAAKLKVPKDRRRIFRFVEKLNPKVISRQDCLEMLSQAGGVIADTVGDLSQRQMLETLKEGAVEQLHEELFGGLKKFRICLYDLIPRDEMVTELLLELKDVCKVDWRREQSEGILKLVKNDEIRARMFELNEVALRGLLKRADKLFRQKSAQILQSVMEKISKLDVEELFSTTQLRAEIFDTLEELDKKKVAIWCIPKEDLISQLPEDIRKLDHVISKPQAQIVEYINTIKGGFSASRIFRAFQDEIDKNPTLVGECDPLRHPTLVAICKNKRLTDRFAFAAKSITQLEVNRCDKKMLMRKLAMSPAFTKEMVDELKFLDGDSLKALMSCIKSYISNSYQGRVFDILCDEVSTFDLRNLLPDAEDRERFINQIREFKGVDIKKALKKDLITTLAYQSLVLKFMKLSEDQIRELIERALTLMGNAFHNGIFVTSYCKEYPSNHEEELQRWDEEMVDRLCLCLLRQPNDITIQMRAEAKKIVGGDAQPKEVLEAIETEMLAMLPDRLLHPMLPGWEADSQLRVFANMRNLLGERVLASVFESASRELPPELAVRFQIAFLDPRNRLSMLACFEDLLGYPFDELSSQRQCLYGYMTGTNDPNPANNINNPKQRFLASLEAILTGTNQCNTTCLQDLVLHLVNEILISVPYRLFLMLCLKITRFDLREVLDDPQTRRLVAVVLLKSFQQNKKEREDPNISLKPPPLTTDSKPKEILDACDNLYEYEMVANDLRMLSGPQIQRLVKEVMDFFKETPIGIFFEKLLDRHQSVTPKKARR